MEHLAQVAIKDNTKRLGIWRPLALLASMAEQRLQQQARKAVIVFAAWARHGTAVLARIALSICTKTLMLILLARLVQMARRHSQQARTMLLCACVSLGNI